MAFDDTFRPRYYIQEKKRSGLIERPSPYLELGRHSFVGPIAEWAEYIATVKEGNYVYPVMTFTEGAADTAHQVAWVCHSEYDSEIDAERTYYHIACDCCLMAEISGEPDSIFECATLQKTLNRRAGFLRNTLQLDKIFRACLDSESGRSNSTASLSRQTFIAESIVWLLQQDKAHPESWMGNISSGEHAVSLLGLILQQPPNQVREIVDDLVEDERVEVDEEIVKLPLAA